MPSSTFNIPTLKGASDWDRWYQILYGCCQIAGIHPILTQQMTEPEDDEEYFDWEVANSWIEGNIRISLDAGGHAHIAGVSGACNMIKALESAYKYEGYTSILEGEVIDTRSSMTANPIIPKIRTYLYRFRMALFTVLWVIVDMPNYLEAWMSDRYSHVDNPSTSGVGQNSTSTPRVISSGDTESTCNVACAGFIENGSPCSRDTPPPIDEAGIWYCSQHHEEAKKAA